MPSCLSFAICVQCRHGSLALELSLSAYHGLKVHLSRATSNQKSKTGMKQQALQVSQVSSLRPTL